MSYVLAVQAKNLDPTQTTTLRRQYRQAVNRRFEDLKRSIKDNISQFTIMDTLLVDAFIPWLAAEANRVILENENPDDTSELLWATPFLLAALNAGFRHADNDLKKIGLTPPMNFNLFDAADEVKKFAKENFKRFQLIIEATVTAVSAVAIANRHNITNALTAILDRVDKVGRHRGRIRSHTAIIGVHAEATLDRLQQFGIQTVSALIELKTTGDSKVCILCRQLAELDNGFGPGIFTIDQARGIIPVHNLCRCGWSPAG